MSMYLSCDLLVFSARQVATMRAALAFNGTVPEMPPVQDVVEMELGDDHGAWRFEIRQQHLPELEAFVLALCPLPPDDASLEWYAEHRSMLGGMRVNHENGGVARWCGPYYGARGG